MGPVKVLSKMPRVVPAKTEPEDEFLSGLHHDQWLYRGAGKGTLQ